MSNLSNITDKIVTDAKVQADEILQKAKARADRTVQMRERMAEDARERILNAAHRDAALASERIQSNAQLQVRDTSLATKQQVISEIFDEAKEELKNLPEASYLNYIKANIGTVGPQTRLVVTKNHASAVAGAFPNAKVSQDEFVESGFIVDQGGIQDNFTFDTYLDFIREDLEAEVARLLFD